MPQGLPAQGSYPYCLRRAIEYLSFLSDIVSKWALGAPPPKKTPLRKLSGLSMRFCTGCPILNIVTLGISIFFMLLQ